MNPMQGRPFKAPAPLREREAGIRRTSSLEYGTQPVTQSGATSSITPGATNFGRDMATVEQDPLATLLGETLDKGGQIFDGILAVDQQWERYELSSKFEEAQQAIEDAKNPNLTVAERNALYHKAKTAVGDVKPRYRDNRKAVNNLLGSAEEGIYKTTETVWAANRTEAITKLKKTPEITKLGVYNQQFNATTDFLQSEYDRLKPTNPQAAADVLAEMRALEETRLNNMTRAMVSHVTSEINDTKYDESDKRLVAKEAIEDSLSRLDDSVDTETKEELRNRVLGATVGFVMTDREVEATRQMRRLTNSVDKVFGGLDFTEASYDPNLSAREVAEVIYNQALSSNPDALALQETDSDLYESFLSNVLRRAETSVMEARKEAALKQKVIARDNAYNLAKEYTQTPVEERGTDTLRQIYQELYLAEAREVQSDGSIRLNPAASDSALGAILETIGADPGVMYHIMANPSDSVAELFGANLGLTGPAEATVVEAYAASNGISIERAKAHITEQARGVFEDVLIKGTRLKAQVEEAIKAGKDDPLSIYKGRAGGKDSFPLRFAQAATQAGWSQEQILGYIARAQQERKLDDDGNFIYSFLADGSEKEAMLADLSLGVRLGRDNDGKLIRIPGGHGAEQRDLGTWGQQVRVLGGRVMAGVNADMSRGEGLSTNTRQGIARMRNAYTSFSQATGDPSLKKELISIMKDNKTPEGQAAYRIFNALAMIEGSGTPASRIDYTKFAGALTDAKGGVTESVFQLGIDSRFPHMKEENKRNLLNLHMGDKALDMATSLGFIDLLNSQFPGVAEKIHYAELEELLTEANLYASASLDMDRRYASSDPFGQIRFMDNATENFLDLQSDMRSQLTIRRDSQTAAANLMSGPKFRIERQPTVNSFNVFNPVERASENNRVLFSSDTPKIPEQHNPRNRLTRLNEAMLLYQKAEPNVSWNTADTGVGREIRTGIDVREAFWVKNGPYDAWVNNLGKTVLDVLGEDSPAYQAFQKTMEKDIRTELDNEVEYSFADVRKRFIEAYNEKLQEDFTDDLVIDENFLVWHPHREDADPNEGIQRRFAARGLLGGYRANNVDSRTVFKGSWTSEVQKERLLDAIYAVPLMRNEKY